jgi:hypothetical protein
MKLRVPHVVPVNKFNSSIFSYFALVNKPEDIEAVKWVRYELKHPQISFIRHLLRAHRCGVVDPIGDC